MVYCFILVVRYTLLSRLIQTQRLSRLGRKVHFFSFAPSPPSLHLHAASALQFDLSARRTLWQCIKFLIGESELAWEIHEGGGKNGYSSIHFGVTTQSDRKWLNSEFGAVKGPVNLSSLCWQLDGITSDPKPQRIYYSKSSTERCMWIPIKSGNCAVLPYKGLENVSRLIKLAIIVNEIGQLFDGFSEY